LLKQKLLLRVLTPLVLLWLPWQQVLLLVQRPLGLLASG